MALTGSRNANQPWLQAIFGEYLFERWETWVEINPENGSPHRVSDRDWVWVESPKGKIRVRARLYKGAMRMSQVSLGETAIRPEGVGPVA